MDRLSVLLGHFGVQAGTFFSGAFCGLEAFGQEGHSGHVHLLQGGRVGLRMGDGSHWSLEEPSLAFFPRPYPHRLESAEGDGTRLVCATLAFGGASGNPLAGALPDYLVLPLKDVPLLAGNLDWLFAEAFGEECGRRAVMDRLFELLVIQLLRHLLAHRGLATGMLAGLADPRLSRALNLMHEDPKHPWTVAELASAASMSRAAFAAHFREVTGQTPADYLVQWRVGLAQKLLRDGRPIPHVADAVGYESPSALARAFRRKTGSSPREWLLAQG
ncbi:AraC family transcriptional regulator [Metapseudomonas furukawaii]|uniref:Transcriptional regulator n=1 Tax=Metapseudomonas furukawaii TaxID=1149133 RepID=A0AAD1FF29_METFU|nr:AraC family transcriptional regulator [Pseudomonas furukawaii]ELS27908.1 Transcriptional regulator, AraC family [Pseudomonas furukawaii]WAG80438.1 AraC family transcriptional regulator [Pseudomonas furukawaii]BAU73108.1 transcriptional regulator [Pseudomonas furukawaii]